MIFFYQKEKKRLRHGVFKILRYVLFICAACQSVHLVGKRGILILFEYLNISNIIPASSYNKLLIKLHV